jgi:hypothetical protein
MKVFYNLRLVGFQFAEGSEGGLHLAVSFETTRRVERWESSPSLMFGNLVCLSLRGRFDQARISKSLLNLEFDENLQRDRFPRFLVTF